MDQVARVVLALEEHDVAEEIMHFLDRNGARVVATAGDERQLQEAVRQLEPDAVVAQPKLVAARGLSGGALFAVDTAESVTALRAAIRVGARGFFVWPVDREELAGAAAATASRPEAGERRATVIAVYGPRGGSGTTFVATHLAAALARRGIDCVLVDADVAFGDLTPAFVSPTGHEPPRTIVDLAPLADELHPNHLEEVLWQHPDGFRVLLAPGSQEAAVASNELVASAVEAAARMSDVVLVHVPRSLTGVTREAFSWCDRALVVLSLDVMSFRAAKRALERAPETETEFVVNREMRAEVTPADVRRVFGREPIGV